MIITSRINTPAGEMTAASVDDGICLLSFGSVDDSKIDFDFLKNHFNSGVLEGTNKHLQLLSSQLEEYFSGKRQVFSVPLVTPGTAFRQAVWKELLSIEYGTTRTYSQQAAAMGNLNSIRAVAAANGANRIAVLIPCHRVIGADGSLTGYAGGLDKKRWLLEHERKHSKRNLTLF
jgi:AraC family transcriptional regulator of adaptative response/methylated-DNA-[protein]-cysteine methyltransferase